MNRMSAFANLAFCSAVSHRVGTKSAATKAGVVKARVSAAESMACFLWDRWRKGSGRFGGRIEVGVRGRGRERGVDRGKLGELVVELALKREGNAEARSERRQPGLSLRDDPSHLAKVRFEAGQRVLEPGDEPRGCQVGLALDGFVAPGARDEERRPAEYVPAEAQIEPADGADPSRLERPLSLGLADVHEE